MILSLNRQFSENCEKASSSSILSTPGKLLLLPNYFDAKKASTDEKCRERTDAKVRKITLGQNPIFSPKNYLNSRLGLGENDILKCEFWKKNEMLYVSCFSEKKK